MWRIFCVVFAAFVSGLVSAEEKALSVQVMPWEEVVVYPQHQATATVLSDHQATIRAEVFSQIDQMFVQEGGRLKQGDIIATFLCRNETYARDILKVKEKMIQTKLDFAHWQRNQNESLTQQALSSVERGKQLETEALILAQELQMTESAHLEAQNLLDKCTIVAPFAGIVTQRFSRIGDFANPGDPVVQIVDPDALYVLAYVQPELASSLESTPSIAFNDTRGEYEAQYLQAVPQLDPTGLQTIRLGLSEKASLPLAGTRGQIKWNSLLPYLPSRYIRQMGNVLGFFTPDDEGKAHFVPLNAAIEGRLAPLDTPLPVITSNLERLREGLSISIEAGE